MGLFRNKTVTVSQCKMVTAEGGGYFAWDGKLYKSDIVRAAIRPKARAMGKAIGKHIREKITNGVRSIEVNPEAYMRFLLEEPNERMTGQQLQEKLAIQLELNNNAFAFIQRDGAGYPIAIYPVNCVMCEAIENAAGTMFIRFSLKKGKSATLPYSDIIHLRKDFNDNDLFGESPAKVLTSVMEVVNTTDQGVVKAVQNSNVIRWLLKYKGSIRPEDVEKNTKKFVDAFLSNDSDSPGVAGIDEKVEAQQITPHDFVPNAAQMDRATKRIYAFFNTNENIVHSNYTEDQWISYYEAVVEPDVMQLSQEFTRKLFSRRERGTGNKIIFEASNLAFASMNTKLNLVQFVDRGIMTPNEVRAIMNMAPAPGGDEYIRRLDTRPTTE